MIGQSSISLLQLESSKPENLVRLANFLNLNIKGMNHQQIAHIVHERIAYPKTRFDTESKRQDYAAMWENF